MWRRLARPARWVWGALTFGGNVQFALVTLGLWTAITAALGGLIWAFSSFPPAFKVLVVVGLGMIMAGVLVDLVGRLRPRFGGIGITVRPSVLGMERVRLEHVGGRARPVTRQACFASVLVYNSRESGGDGAKAKEVVPHVEIFDHGGDLRAEHVGWDVAPGRDFSPNGERHRLYVVGKWKDEEDCYFVPGPIPDAPSLGSQRMVQSTYDVRITFRGKNLRQPIVEWFTLVNRGEGRCPQLHRTE